MAISKADFNNINITPTASKAIKWNASANGFEAGDLGGSMVLLATQTASGSANLSFTSGIDNTYDSYVFKFINIHPATDNVNFLFNMSVDTGSNYNVTKTTTFFLAEHFEDASQAQIGYQTAKDLAQGTGFQSLMHDLGNANDENLCGEMYLFNPSSTTFVKHFIARTNAMYFDSPHASFDNHIAGYGNTTSAVDAIQFKMDNGNIDSGVIKMYGIT